MGDYYLMPFESAYGEIEVKSKLNKDTFCQSIENIKSFKRLYKEIPGNGQVLPNLELKINGITWNKAGYKKPFGAIFAYESLEPSTILQYFHSIEPLEPELLPDIIVLFQKKTIICRIRYFEDEKFYASINNTYQGFMTLPCNDDTLPIFLLYLMCRTSETKLKLMDTSDILNEQIDKALQNMGAQSVVKFSQEYSSED